MYDSNNNSYDGLQYTPPVSPNSLSKSEGVRTSFPITSFLKPGAYSSMLSNTAHGLDKKRGKEDRYRECEKK